MMSSERYTVVQGGVVMDKKTSRVYQKSNIAGYLNKITRDHEAAIERAKAERTEEILQMVRETWFKLPGDDQENLNYRRGIQEGINRVADAIRSMGDG
jgi:hypothetical protein